MHLGYIRKFLLENIPKFYEKKACYAKILFITKKVLFIKVNPEIEILRKTFIKRTERLIAVISKQGLHYIDLHYNAAYMKCNITGYNRLIFKSFVVG